MRKVIFKLFYFIYVTLLICSFEVQKFYDRVYKLTMLRAEKFRIGSSAARETELSMMNTRMRLVKMWWLMSLWQNTRTLKKNNNKSTADISVIWIATCLCLHKHNFSLRVCVAEDEEGTSLWDRSDLLLLYQVGDDRPRPRWDFRILLLRCSVVIVLLLLLKRKQEICNV